MRKNGWITVAAGLLVVALVAPAHAAYINEFVANDTGPDDREFVELCGVPGAVLDGLTLVLIEGDITSNPGVIDEAVDLTGYTMGQNSKFVIGGAAVNPDLEMPDGWIENGGNNILLVENFSAQVDDDVDLDDDCVVDLGVDIGTITDGIGTGRPNEGDCVTYFGIPAIGPDGSFDPAGGALCDDCDYVTPEWLIICLDGTDPTSDPCTQPPYRVSRATPGEPNLCAPAPLERSSWGSLKSRYR
jgi:hypothetical protein